MDIGELITQAFNNALDNTKNSELEGGKLHRGPRGHVMN